MSEYSPATALDCDDPGDDTIARFRYQFCIVAINAFQLISNPGSAVSLICENFEDVIVQRSDGNFDALQVKTKLRHLPPLKANELAVEKSLIRFAKLNARFPERFSSFQFVTNHEMWEEQENSSNLLWLLSEVRSSPKIKGLRKTNPKRALVEKISEASGTPVDSVIQMLQRTKCVARREDVKSIDRAVSDAITQCTDCANLPYATVLKLADDAIAAAFHASCNGRKTLVAKLYASDVDYHEVFAEASLEGKTIDTKIISDIISERLQAENELVDIDGLVNLDSLPKGLSRMVQKMAKGGVETVRIQHMTDLVRSLEALEVRWATKFGREKAKAQMKDVLGRTLTECVEAQVESSNTKGLYGSAQYTETKTRLEKRLSEEADTLHGCRIEHLMGAVGALTEDCKVWWSDEFELQEHSS